jgi:hypothetical protein
MSWIGIAFGEWLAAARNRASCRQNQRNKMSFGVMRLVDFTIRVSPPAALKQRKAIHGKPQATSNPRAAA